MEEFSFGLFDELLEGEVHPLQIDDYEDEEDDLQRSSTKPSLVDRLRARKHSIYEPVGGGTMLHSAIRCGKQAGIDALLQLYREDFNKVRDHLVRKYGWDAADKIWFSKTILLASTEGQCQSAKNLENQQVGAEDLRRAVLVLLKYPVNGEDVAVLHPSESDRLPVTQLIQALVPNGFLSWNYVGTEGKRETFVQSAVLKAMHHVIERLYELGAPIAIPGYNPLLTAIRCNRKETVNWLLTEHFDHFDCTLRDARGCNALIVAMQRNDVALFDLVLEKMIAYRRKYFAETEEEAFHEIFLLEHEEYSYTFTFVKKSVSIFERVEKAIQKYKLKLSHRWKNSVVLGSLIERSIALDYCFEGIRNDPQLLGLTEHETTTILHQLLRWGHLEFVREMYTKHPEVQSFFNADGAFETLRKVIFDQKRETVQLMLEHHEEFLKNDMEKLKDKLLSYYQKQFYEERKDIFKEYFPELQDSIEEVLRWTHIEDYYYGIEGSFAKANIDVSNLDKLPEPYPTVRGSNGETLLHLAVDKDEKKLLVRMLEAGCELDDLDNDGNHPVHLVKSEEMLDLIIDRHPEGRNLIQRTNNDGCNVLHKVCQQRMDYKPMINLLEKLIDYGADVHQLTKHGESAVFFVGSCRLLDVLLKHKVQLDFVNNYGETPLERHLNSGNTCMAMPLFSYVHDLPSFKEHAHKYLAPMLNQSGHVYTYDYKVIFEKYPEAARIMLDSVYDHSREEACRLFSKACTTGFVYVVELFLDGNYDLDYNYKDQYEDTPFLGMINHMEQVNARVIKRLLEKGVDLQARCRWGRDALMYLIWRYRTAKWNGLGLDTVQLMLDHGASINTTDEDGNTPLHLAFEQKELELVEFLIQNGANLKGVNMKGKRPFEMVQVLEPELFYFYSE